MKRWFNFTTLMISGMILVPAMMTAGYSGMILLVAGLCWLGLLGCLHLLAGMKTSDGDLTPVDGAPLIPEELPPKHQVHPGVEAVLSDRVIIERTTTAILDDFINCDFDQIEVDMNRVLSRLGSFLGAKRCYLYQFGARNQECLLWLAWQSPGNDDVCELPATLSAAEATRLYKILELDPVVLVNQVGRPVHPVATHLPWSQDEAKVRSCGVVRIQKDSKNLCFLGFDASATSEWGTAEKNLLQIVSNQFSTMFSRLEARQSQMDAMEALKASNRAKSEFLANMSHEIRTPLNGVIGIADLLMDMDLTPSQHEYADIISKSGTMLMNLVTDILDFSKIEAGQMDLDPIETDVRTLVEDLIGLTAFNAQNQGLEMVCRLAPDLPEQVMVDPNRLRQILTNLLNNAVKFTQEGHIYLNVEPVSNGCGGQDIRFQVRDTGIGITPEQGERIFQKFTQADASTTRRFGGTGLGLSICRHLVDLMGGRIWAEGVPGEGSTFSFTVPLKMVAPAVQPLKLESPGRVLLVTGNELVGDVLAEQIRHLGHKCIVTSSVTEAEKLLVIGASGHQEQWDVIALDPSTLMENVYFILARVEDAPVNNRTKVFLLSQLADKPQENVRWSPYVAGILPRPVRAGRLAALMDENSQAGSRAKDGATATTMSTDVEAGQDSGKVLNVLLAEDNPFNQKVACGMLRRLGCQVSVAENGNEALSLMEKEDFDLIFMDCQMPEMDGFEASRRIRQMPGAAGNIPIIAITANAFREDRDACMTAGMDDFLTKPVHKKQLAQVISKWEAVIASGERQLT